MFAELECCEKCFMHKQYNHNEWVFHDNFLKLGETLQRKCKIRTLKNIKLPHNVLQELERYDANETEIIDQIIDQQKEKIKPEIQSFEIKYKGVYVFSLHETRNFPDFNLVAKILLTLKKADFKELSSLNMEIQKCNFLSFYEFVKQKYQNTSEKNIKLKSIQQLLSQREFRRSQASTSKGKRISQNNPVPSKNIQSETEIAHHQPTSFQECIFKERSQNLYVFKKKQNSNLFVKPQTLDKRKNNSGRIDKMGERGSANISLPKLSKQEEAARKRHLKRIRCKKFSNRYSNINKKTEILNKLVRNQYGKIKEQKYEFLSRNSDAKGDSDYDKDFELEQLSQTSQEEENIFRNYPSFTKVNCTELLNQLCKPDEPVKKFSETDSKNVPQIESTKSIKKGFEQNQFAYEFDCAQNLCELNSFDANINNIKSEIDLSGNDLKPIKETDDQKLENYSCHSSAVQSKKIGKVTGNLSIVRENSSEKIKRKLANLSEQSGSPCKSPKIQKITQNFEVLQIGQTNFGREMKVQPLDNYKSKRIEEEEIKTSKVSLDKKNENEKRSNFQNQSNQSFYQSRVIQNINSPCKSHQAQNNSPNQSQRKYPQINQQVNEETDHEIIYSQIKQNSIRQKDVTQELYPWQEEAEQTNTPILKIKAKPKKNANSSNQNDPNRASQTCSSVQGNRNQLISGQEALSQIQYSLFNDYFSQNLTNFAQKVSQFNSHKSTHFRSEDPSKIQKVQQYFNLAYPCPRVLLQTKNKKKISKMIQNFINPYLQQIQQNEKEWVQLIQIGVCKIFLLNESELPKKVYRILWNRSNSMLTKLYLTEPDGEIQSFIELGQLQKDYKEVLFLFYDQNFELNRQTFKIKEKHMTQNLSQVAKFKKFKFNLTIGEKHVQEREQAQSEPNHIFIAFEAKSYPNQNSQQSLQNKEKTKMLNQTSESDLQVKVQVYEKRKDSLDENIEEGLIGTIERRGKFFFELNLEQGQYRFYVTIFNQDQSEELKRKNVELLFYSEAQIETSSVKQTFH